MISVSQNMAIFQAAKISTTCHSQWLYSTSNVNADPRGNSLFGFVGDKNEDENGSFVDCITLSDFFLDN